MQMQQTGAIAAGELDATEDAAVEAEEDAEENVEAATTEDIDEAEEAVVCSRGCNRRYICSCKGSN